MQEVFRCETKMISGYDILSALAEFHARRVFLVTDPFFTKNGWSETVLQAAKPEVSEIFDQVIPDPTVELAAAGAARVKAFRPDLIIALGGGSALDCAKAIRYFGEFPCPLAAIPTTSGSGSEVTDFAILTHGGVKHPLVDPSLRPEMALLEGNLLTRLPKTLIADSGFDVLTHALEACAATGGNTIAACFSREAFRLAFHALPHSYGGSLSHRLTVHKAATLAGLAFTHAGLGLCHALSHALGGAFHVPHGRLNAILLPAVVELNAPFVRENYAALARAAGISTGSDTIALRQLRNELLRLRKTLELPQSLAQAGVDLSQLRQKEPQVVQAVLADPCCSTNPGKVDSVMVREILRQVAGHG